MSRAQQTERAQLDPPPHPSKTWVLYRAVKEGLDADGKPIIRQEIFPWRFTSKEEGQAALSKNALFSMPQEQGWECRLLTETPYWNNEQHHILQDYRALMAKLEEAVPPPPGLAIPPTPQ